MDDERQLVTQIVARLPEIDASLVEALVTCARQGEDRPHPWPRIRWTSPGGVSFCLVPPGTFVMGAQRRLADLMEHEPDLGAEHPPHSVRLTRAFLMSDVPVTRSLWTAVTGESPGPFQGGDLPVTGVTATEIDGFLAELSRRDGLPYRLPTEAEWEHACRAGSSDVAWATAKERARFVRTVEQHHRYHLAYVDGSIPFPMIPPRRGQPGPVHDVEPNAWGLRGMLGNVWEVCADGFEHYPADSATRVDPHVAPEADVRVRRGGAWHDPSYLVTCTSRRSVALDTRLDDCGFRVVSSGRPR